MVGDGRWVRSPISGRVSRWRAGTLLGRRAAAAASRGARLRWLSTSCALAFWCGRCNRFAHLSQELPRAANAAPEHGRHRWRFGSVGLREAASDTGNRVGRERGRVSLYRSCSSSRAVWHRNLGTRQQSGGGAVTSDCSSIVLDHVLVRGSRRDIRRDSPEGEASSKRRYPPDRARSDWLRIDAAVAQTTSSISVQNRV